MRNEYMRKYMREYRLNRRDPRQHAQSSIIDLLGGKCVKCGFYDKRALVIDHTKGLDSCIKKHKDFGCSELYYKYLLSLNAVTLLKELQVLCENCNRIKQREQREYRMVNRID